MESRVLVGRVEREVEFYAEILRPSWSDDLRMTTRLPPKREEEQPKKTCEPEASLTGTQGRRYMNLESASHTRVDVWITLEQHVLRDSALIPIAETLAARAEQARSLDEVRKKDLRAGDRVLIKTKNSLYTIWVLDDDVYRVSGGWFDLRGMAPQRMAINGCTWGGTAIKRDILAACGLRLEFGNTVLTTRIREVRVIPAKVQTSLN